MVSSRLATIARQDSTFAADTDSQGNTLQVQMMGGGQTVEFGGCDPCTFHPDLEWLQNQMTGPKPPKLVYLVNPCNPTGALESPPGQHCRPVVQAG